jgi:arabinose-5-phosphate isomerase
VVTDGDLRRALLRNPETSQLHIHEMMTVLTLLLSTPEEYISQAEQLMIEKKIATILGRLARENER